MQYMKCLLYWQINIQCNNLKARRLLNRGTIHRKLKIEEQPETGRTKRANGKASKPCLTREVVHILCVQTKIEQYDDGIPANQPLKSSALLHSRYHLQFEPALQIKTRQKQRNAKSVLAITISQMMDLVLDTTNNKRKKKVPVITHLTLSNISSERTHKSSSLKYAE